MQGAEVLGSAFAPVALNGAEALRGTSTVAVTGPVWFGLVVVPVGPNDSADFEGRCLPAFAEILQANTGAANLRAVVDDDGDFGGSRHRG